MLQYIMNLKYRRKTNYQSCKAGVVYCDSSYEIKAALILDADPEVVTYETHRGFIASSGKKRVTDFLVFYTNGTKKLIEVKPFRRVCQYQDQINDNIEFAKKNKYEFEVWGESKLGFSSEHDATKWADLYLSQTPGVDFVEARKQRNREKAKRHYDNKISKNKITFFCEFCKEEHTTLQVTYDRNITKNGQFICIKENGHIVGSKPKPHLQRDNPYADEGKKQCTKCQRIIPFECFGKDKSRSDGLASRCKECRAIIAKDKYENKTNEPILVSQESHNVLTTNNVILPH